MSVSSKLLVLRKWLEGRSLAIAFSGGLDSRFLAFMAGRSAAGVRLLHAAGPHVPDRESAWAKTWAAGQDLSLTVVPLNVLENSAVAANSRERCYHCKRAVFTGLLAGAGGLPLCDGTNASDMETFRPGLRAIRELGILSPLAEVGFTKADIREAAALVGLDAPDQLPAACLLTRFPYGYAPSASELAGLEKAENAVRSRLEKEGTRLEFRLRFVRPGAAPELHVQTGLCPETAEALACLVQEQGLGLPVVRYLERVSGFYDQESGAH